VNIFDTGGCGWVGVSGYFTHIPTLTHPQPQYGIHGMHDFQPINNSTIRFGPTSPSTEMNTFSFQQSFSRCDSYLYCTTKRTELKKTEKHFADC
jgi:hypothetical protein